MESNREFSLTTILKGFGYAVIISVILILLVSIVFHLTSLSEKFLDVVSLAIIFLSVFIGGFIASKTAGNRGLIQGISVAVIFLSFNLILSLIFSVEGFTLSSFLFKAGTILTSGTLGGIIGISFAN